MFIRFRAYIYWGVMVVPVVSISLDSETYTKLYELARESGLSVGGYIKAIIREYLKSRGVLEKSLESRVSDLEARVKRLEELLARGQRGDLGGGEY